ncbi:LysR family transcriptional regulator ArgP [Sedimentitalea todarodis]|uniref:LysR family transcriptional regulator ArgP n=1 Tax=Sedimentitalea todarodis TaxID=1631240 RepID=A0ABU3VJF1_9RHOB|nr:LysR family transcriptional regulator ArgP [Sedimentitalea todarodis]MDU9006322.1 LysR family transcriptional regulator ArgP [Sedimentitalea todarodis]
MQFDPHQLAALTAVLRNGSFEAAASDLGVTPSAVSQRIRALEDRIGGALVLRGAPCTGTPAGTRLAKHAEDVTLLEAQLSRELALENTTGPARIKIAVNADSLATWLIHALPNAQDVLFDLVIDDQDHSAQWLRRGEVSMAITALEKPAAGCDAWSLGALRYIPTASPLFVDRWFHDSVDAETLLRAPCLTFDARDMLQRRWIDQMFGAKLSPPAHYLPSTHAFVDAARLGLGWGMNPEQLVTGHLVDGTLVPLIADAPLDVPLSLQASRIMAPTLAPLVRAIRAAATEGLVQT